MVPDGSDGSFDNVGPDPWISISVASNDNSHDIREQSNEAITANVMQFTFSTNLYWFGN